MSFTRQQYINTLTSACWSTRFLPPRGLSGPPLWRVRGPVGLPLSSSRPFFPGGGRPLRSGLLALRSGLSWVMGLSPPRSILLHTPRGAPASEKESGGSRSDRMSSCVCESPLQLKGAHGGICSELTSTSAALCVEWFLSNTFKGCKKIYHIVVMLSFFPRSQSHSHMES